MAAVTDGAIAWLLRSREPAIRGMTRRDLLGEAEPRDLQDVVKGRLVRGLLAGQQPDGGFGGRPYNKWTGAHWRLVSLVELEIPPGERRAMGALDTVLDCWANPRRLVRRPTTKSGLPLSDGSIEGNALAVACRLGAARDERTERLVDALLRWQWPDGGWNCDPRATGRRSSFHESLIPMWGLWEYAEATGNRPARQAANRTAELFLDHRIFRRLGSDEPIHPSVVKLHYPAYWHYDVLQAMHLLARMGKARDKRARDALDLLVQRRLPDGRWRPDASWWSQPGSARAPEAVDWGRDGPSEMLTLNALRVLRAAGRPV